MFCEKKRRKTKNCIFSIKSDRLQQKFLDRKKTLSLVIAVRVLEIRSFLNNIDMSNLTTKKSKYKNVNWNFLDNYWDKLAKKLHFLIQQLFQRKRKKTSRHWIKKKIVWVFSFLFIGKCKQRGQMKPFIYDFGEKFGSNSSILLFCLYR